MMSIRDTTKGFDSNNQDLSQFRHLSHKNIFRLFSLSRHLEQAFREDYRRKATAIVHYSVYGLVGLYLLVVLPIALFIHDPLQDLWRNSAVYPIGVALLIIWTSTQIPKLNKYAEFTLRFGVFLSLSGTIYGFMALGNTLLGLVAGCETIYVMIVGFSMLMLRTRDVLSSSIAAFLVAALIAALSKLEIIWVSTFIFFWVPLLICAVTGYLLEFAARQNFIHTLLHQQDRMRMVNDMATLVSDVDDLDTVLSLALERVCTHAGWTAGRVVMVNEVHPDMSARYVGPGLDHDALSNIEQIWRSPLSPIIEQVATSGIASWQNFHEDLESVILDKPQTFQMRLVFPIKLDQQVLATLEFFSIRKEQPDDRLLSLMDNVSDQFGRVFERRRQQHDLKIKALHDALTGLPNRAYLFDRLRTEIARSKRDIDYGFSILFMDVDHFKWVNDSLGHLAGDRLLTELSKRLQHGVRAVDFVARLGGDEFAIVIEAARDKTQVMAAMNRIQRQLEMPFILADQQLHIGLSIGVAMYDAHYVEPEELLRDADTAMYHAKQKGRNTFVIFENEMREQVVGRLKMVAELREAIERNQFVLHYQPIVCVNSTELVGFEALIRWQHPERGLLSPLYFIPLAEETGLIVHLTEWVLQQACQQLSVWQHQQGNTTTSISVNLCASYLTQPDMPDQIIAVAKAANIDPSTLRLEITETQIVSNADICMTNISRLREASFGVYIDDFGTGYSSLSYLASFKVSTLKIDKSFLTNLGDGGKEAHIVQIIISLGHHLDLTVIAEGVETEEQLNILRDMGCDLVQGYLLSKPVDSETANKMVLHQQSGHVVFQNYKETA